MKRSGIIGLTVLVAIMMTFGGVFAKEGPIETVAKGCKKELVSYCKDVTPGEGRILACLYAHEDKISGKCEFALYDAAVQLERAINALVYVANECEDDLDEFCTEVPAGKGRLLDCLKKNDDKVSERCKQARKDVGAE